MAEHRDWVTAAASALYGAMLRQAERLVLRGHEGWVTAAAFAPDGRIVVTASYDGTARLWPVFGSLRELIEEARRRLPRLELTVEERRRYFLPEA